ncbi:winged helix-turn-helix domain-containing protein [Kitasatospora sp. NPDC059408]|uniref:winged helix-turn-helix domain-containing protein n=1 Tax=Kitasatospora sp. NPDC059408 TaxID=3346823 RepID=UPI00367B6BD0
MSSSSTATLPLPTATPHLRAVRSVQPVPAVPSVPSVPSGIVNSQVRAARSVPPHVLPPRPAPTVAPAAVPPAPPQSLLAALPEGASVVAALPQGALPHTLLAQYGAQFGDPAGRPMVGYLVLVPAENPAGAGSTAVGPAGGPAGSSAARPVRPAGRGITVDNERRNAYVDGRLLDLTYLEFELLAHLTEHPQRVHTRDHLVSAVWGYGHVGDGRTVDVHVARLRRKLGSAYRDTIVTVRRVGYKYTPVA